MKLNSLSSRIARLALSAEDVGPVGGCIEPARLSAAAAVVLAGATGSDNRISALAPTRLSNKARTMARRAESSRAEHR